VLFVFVLQFWYGSDHEQAHQIPQAAEQALAPVQQQMQSMHQQLQQQGQQMQQLGQQLEQPGQQQQNQRQELVGRISDMPSVVDAQVCSDFAILCDPNQQRKHCSLTSQGLLVQEHHRCVRVDNSALGENELGPFTPLQCS
jgi:hypothetical protein